MSSNSKKSKDVRAKGQSKPSATDPKAAAKAAGRKAARDATKKKQQRPQQPAALNKDVELIVKANAFVNPVMPKPGFLVFGEAGIEFGAEAGSGFVQVPWDNVAKVRADVYGDFVRSIDVVTDEGHTLPFVITDGAEALRCINRHIGREKLTSGGQNWSKIAKKDKNGILSLFKRKKGKTSETPDESVATAGEDPAAQDGAGPSKDDDSE